MKITLVTGNKGKLAEWQRILPDSVVMTNAEVDLPEIQSMQLSEIVADKARRAYVVVGSPVIVEDVSAGLEVLNGLPGPFIKFFNERLGRDALFQLAGKVSGSPASVRCGIAYYDGTELVQVESLVHGTVVEPRGDAGFGFDVCFVPEGQTSTYAQMSPGEKDAVSHRAKAIRALAAKIEQLS